jgi:hypothetical protein
MVETVLGGVCILLGRSCDALEAGYKKAMVGRQDEHASPRFRRSVEGEAAPVPIPQEGAVPGVRSRFRGRSEQNGDQAEPRYLGPRFS